MGGKSNSKMPPRIFIFSIALGTKTSFLLKSSPLLPKGPKKFLGLGVPSNTIIKRWSEAESFTIFENHVYSH